MLPPCERKSSLNLFSPGRSISGAVGRQSGEKLMRAEKRRASERARVARTVSEKGVSLGGLRVIQPGQVKHASLLTKPMT